MKDTERRLTNEWGLRKNEWFNKNLPDYLQPLPNTEENENMSVDDSLVAELSKVIRNLLKKEALIKQHFL